MFSQILRNDACPWTISVGLKVWTSAIVKLVVMIESLSPKFGSWAPPNVCRVTYSRELL